MAPILSFTAEEAWQVMSGSEDRSVFEEIYHPLPAHGLDDAVLSGWGDLRQLRELANKKIEEKREAKEIGSSLAAVLEIATSGATHGSLARLGDDLRFVFIVSGVKLVRAEGSPTTVLVRPSAHTKCERCWHYRADVSAQGLCGRCETNLHGAGEKRVYA
jgi:isoleucyl-tRNA synthetase